MFSPKTSDSPERLEETPNGDENPHNLLRNTQYKRSDTREGFEVNIIPFHVVFVPRVLGKQLADAVLTCGRLDGCPADQRRTNIPTRSTLKLEYTYVTVPCV